MVFTFQGIHRPEGKSFLGKDTSVFEGWIWFRVSHKGRFEGLKCTRESGPLVVLVFWCHEAQAHVVANTQTKANTLILLRN